MQEDPYGFAQFSVALAEDRFTLMGGLVKTVRLDMNIVNLI